MKRLPALARRKVKAKPLLPREIDQKLVPPAGRRRCSPTPTCRWARWTATPTRCVLEQLHKALGRRDVFASPSNLAS
nr:hypothetical protein [Streptomyces caniscabiei]